MVHDCVLALGFFDGIHLGHAALLDRTRQRAQALGLTPAALSFDTHPDTLVFGTAVPLLNTMAERELLMRRLCGMERVIFAHFDEAMMHMPWQVFVEDYLVRQLHAKHVVCGHDFHFGDRGQGDPARLQEKCRELAIGCDVIPEIRVDGSAVSSTRIRRLLQTGRCEEAVRLLGHGQLVTGRVTRNTRLIFESEGALYLKDGTLAATSHARYMKQPLDVIGDLESNGDIWVCIEEPDDPTEIDIPE